jgi:ATP-dependent Clp protease ATP-binding subunit ClpC
MKYNDLFDRKALNLMAVAKRGAISGRKPAITTLMVAKAIIINEEDASRGIFNEMRVDMRNFYRMANKRIEEMPSVSEPCPYVDDELDGVVRESARHDSGGNFIAGSVTAESMLRNILNLHRNECNEYVHEEESGTTPTQPHDILERYTTDWTSLAADGHIAPVIGRENELQAVQRSLLRKTKNNPVLIGDAGTGKTAIVEGFAVKIAQGDVHQKLCSKKILALNTTSLLEEAGLGGFKEAMDIASHTEDVILFIDEIHSLSKGTFDVLKPFMARGELKLIGATTAEEYSRVLESDKAFARRLQKIDIPELSEEETLHLLEEIKENYEIHHGISIGDDALKAAVSLSHRYVTNRCQPDKSIDLVDEAAAKVRLAGMPGPVCEDDIREVLSKRTGIPVEKIGKDDASRLINMEQQLSGEVLGQPEAVTAVAKVVRRNSVGLSDAHRPTASFMFVGPSGVGKTALAQALSKNLMGTEDALLRIDMSEYQQPFTVSRLIGSPPGYVGYQTGGQLTEVVSRHPYSVVLLDEIEKAHPAVFELFLQVLDYGRLTDGRGRTVDFTNTIVIFTSNLGANDKNSNDTAIRNYFTPEFLNRLDGVVHFNRLETPVLLDIANKILGELSNDLRQKGYIISFDQSVAEYIVGIDTGLGQGARFIRRAIEQNITDFIVPKMLSGELVKNKLLTLSVVDGNTNIVEDIH